LLLNSFISAQVVSIDSTKIDNLENIETDTLQIQVFILKEVMVFNRPEFKNWEDRKRYYILRRKTKKVYPYAVLASKRIKQLDERLDRIETKRGKKKYTKIIQDYIEKEFGPKLKKFTQSEGRIMIKLIHRQTGTNTYNIVKKYRSGWKAFWSNTTASIFNLSLKAEYNPFKFQEDLAIESILRESFENGSLDYESAFWEKLDVDDTYFDPLPKEEK